MALRSVSLDELTIDDERSFAHVALYGRLKQALRRSGHRFCIPRRARRSSWDRALFLNLTFWSGETAPTCCARSTSPPTSSPTSPGTTWSAASSRGWRRRRGRAATPADALFFAESIASAFDLYLVGRLLPNAPDSDFITTQVPLMAECAQQAGLSEAAFAALLEEVRASRSGPSRICARCSSTRPARSCAAPAVPEAEAALGALRRPSLRAAAAPLPAVELDPLRARLRGRRPRAPTPWCSRSTPPCGRPRSRWTGWPTTASMRPGRAPRIALRSLRGGRDSLVNVEETGPAKKAVPVGHPAPDDVRDAGVHPVFVRLKARVVAEQVLDG